jgi:hypothetical protein
MQLLPNVYREMPTLVVGTRMLEATYGLDNYQIADPRTPGRSWVVRNLYLPVQSRALGGLRAKLVDQKGFITFCNQRDLEVVLGLGIPGQYCPWSGKDYVGPDDPDWFGLCADDDDLADDLYDRELNVRADMQADLEERLRSIPASDPFYNFYNQQPVLTADRSIERFVHLGGSIDVFEKFVVFADMEPETGRSPDTRFDTVERRWMRSERTKVRWERS